MLKKQILKWLLKLIGINASDAMIDFILEYSDDLFAILMSLIKEIGILKTGQLVKQVRKNPELVKRVIRMVEETQK